MHSKAKERETDKELCPASDNHFTDYKLWSTKYALKAIGLQAIST